MLTQAQLVAAIAERANLSKADAKSALTALEGVVLDQLGDAERVKIGGLVQLTVRRHRRRARAETRPRARRSRSGRRKQVWMSVLVSSLAQRTRCHRYRRHAAGSHPPDSDPPASSPVARERP